MAGAGRRPAAPSGPTHSAGGTPTRPQIICFSTLTVNAVEHIISRTPRPREPTGANLESPSVGGHRAGQPQRHATGAGRRDQPVDRPPVRDRRDRPGPLLGREAARGPGPEGEARQGQEGTPPVSTPTQAAIPAIA